MIIVFNDQHKEDLAFLATLSPECTAPPPSFPWRQTTRRGKSAARHHLTLARSLSSLLLRTVLAEFSKLALDFIRNGANRKVFAGAARTLPTDSPLPSLFFRTTHPSPRLTERYRLPPLSLPLAPALSRLSPIPSSPRPSLSLFHTQLQELHLGH